MILPWITATPDYNSMSSSELEAAVRKDPDVLAKIKNPTACLVEIGMQSNPIAYRFHPNPSDELTLEALSRDGNVLRYVENPTDEMIFTALTNSGWAITYVENPTQAMKLAAVRSHDSHNQAMAFLHDSGEDIQIAAVTSRCYNQYHFIRDPSETVKIALVQHAPNAFPAVRKPSLAVQIAALQAKVPSGSIDVSLWFDDDSLYKLISPIAFDAVIPGLSKHIAAVVAKTDDWAAQQRLVQGYSLLTRRSL